MFRKAILFGLAAQIAFGGGQSFVHSAMMLEEGLRSCMAQNRNWTVQVLHRSTGTRTFLYHRLGLVLRDAVAAPEDWVLHDSLGDDPSRETERQANRFVCPIGPCTGERYRYRFDGSYVTQGQRITASWLGIGIERTDRPLLVLMPSNFRTLIMQDGPSAPSGFTLAFWAKPRHFDSDVVGGDLPSGLITLMRLDIDIAGLRDAILQARQCATSGRIENAPAIPSRCDQSNAFRAAIGLDLESCDP